MSISKSLQDDAWKKSLKNLISKGCTDSSVEDFIMEHPGVNAKEIWDYVYELGAPYECKGCTYIQLVGMPPCSRCSRRIQVKDYYKPR